LATGAGDPDTTLERLDRASLAFFDGEPALVLYDGGLRVRAVVSVAQDRPTVVLLDENKRQVFHAP
jgi:hypothetical protein